MLQGSLANYKVLGVGKVVTLQGTHLQVPSDCAPVHVVSIESCATGILVPGQLVLWPIPMLALYTPPGTAQDQIAEILFLVFPQIVKMTDFLIMGYRFFSLELC